MISNDKSNSNLYLMEQEFRKMLSQEVQQRKAKILLKLFSLQRLRIIELVSKKTQRKGRYMIFASSEFNLANTKAYTLT